MIFPPLPPLDGLFTRHVQKLTRIVLAGLEGTNIKPTTQVSETCWAVVKVFPIPNLSNAEEANRLIFAEVYHQVLSSRQTPKE